MGKPEYHVLPKDPADAQVVMERAEWEALVEADLLHLLPAQALAASIKHLAGRLLEMTEPEA